MSRALVRSFGSQNAMVGRLDDLGAGNLALYIGKYHKIQNLQMEFCFFDLMSLDLKKNHLAIYP